MNVTDFFMEPVDVMDSLRLILISSKSGDGINKKKKNIMVVGPVTAYLFFSGNPRQ